MIKFKDYNIKQSKFNLGKRIYFDIFEGDKLISAWGPLYVFLDRKTNKKILVKNDPGRRIFRKKDINPKGSPDSATVFFLSKEKYEKFLDVALDINVIASNAENRFVRLKLNGPELYD